MLFFGYKWEEVFGRGCCVWEYCCDDDVSYMKEGGEEGMWENLVE